MINSKYEIAELCNQLKATNNEIINHAKLNTYQRAKLDGQNEAFDLIIQHILKVDD